MIFLIELVFLFLLAINLYFISRRKYSFTLFCVPLYLVFSDYLLFFSGYGLGEVSVAKIFVELVFVQVFLCYLFRRGGRLTGQGFVLFLFVASALLLVWGAGQNGFVSAVNGWRSIFLYIFLAEMIVHDAGDKLSLNAFVNGIIFVCVANGLIAIYQYYSYDGNIESTWRYELIQASWEYSQIEWHERFMSYQLERDEKLRASGLMNSALLFGFVASLAFVLCVRGFLVFKSKGARFAFILAGGVLILSVHVSQVRTAIFVIVFSALYASYFDRIKSKAVFGVAAFLLAPIFILFVGYFFSALLDSSAQGRVLQYYDAISSVSLMGEGLGKYVGRFDSFYVYSFRELGVFSILPIWYLVRAISRVNYDVHRQMKKNDKRAFSLMMALILSLSSVMAVQHTAGSVFYFCIVFLLCVSGSNELPNRVHRSAI
ncbi:hypothetical protein [Zhongshania aliphaticivorans]|uniref:Uncharacterized protein n=1 Tax=Zhongshania aliphaticivorans TaxID=1470434 RepID=A0A127M176_9GAMM|nr:hypothetical protein [Zhongshania aliphaticivorans]AMO66976.1 hypothetical protein AZF00_01080 [Zhongshania aliphaticivorans]